MDFHERMKLFLRNRSLMPRTLHPLPEKSESDHSTDITENCEICGEPDAESRGKDGDSDIWCWACFAEQRPEEAY